MEAVSPVREFIPEARISCARIRSLLARNCALSRWSRGPSEAIRPMRLAILMRRYIWQGHDMPLTAIRKRLSRPGGSPLDFEVVVEIDIGESEPQQVRSVTRFSLGRSRRIAVRIDLRLDALQGPITSRILLPAATAAG